MEDFPDNLLLNIFSNLSYTDLCLSVRMVSRRWRNLTQDADLWRYVEIPVHFTDRRFLMLVKQVMEHVEELDCTKCENLTDDALLGLAEMQLTRLKKLSVPIMASFPDVVYECLAKSCPLMEELESVRANIQDSCHPLECQRRFVGLTVVHDKPVSSYGRIRRVVHDFDNQKRSKWESDLTSVASVCEGVKEYRCNRGLEYLDDSGLQNVAVLFPQLRSLELRQCSVSDIGWLNFFSQHTTGMLRKLILDKPGELTDKGLSIIADNCPNLLNLKVSRCTKVTPFGVNYVTSKCSKLIELHINNAQAFYEEDTKHERVEIDDDCLRRIGASCPQLISFRLFYSKLVSWRGMRGLTHGCPYLRGLMLFECPSITDRCLETLLEFKFLKSLVVVNCESIRPKGVIDFIMMAPNLHRLTLYCNNKLFYGDMSQLTEDTYNNIDLNTKNFKPNVIKSLTLKGIGGGFLQLLTVLCPELHSLDLRDGPLVGSLALVSVMMNCERLRSLDIAPNTNLDDSFLKGVCEYGLELCQLGLSSTVAMLNTGALEWVIETCPSLAMISMNTHNSGIDEGKLVQTARRSHKGYCFLHVDPELEANPDSAHRLIEIRFTPLKYLNSINGSLFTA